MEQFAKRSRFMSELIREIKRTVPSSTRDDYVTWFNTIFLPRGYLYVDPNGLLHIVHINCKSKRADGLQPSTLSSASGPTGPLGVAQSADVIWDFNPETGMWNVVKDRTGDFEKLCPIKCGGIPERKVRV